MSYLEIPCRLCGVSFNIARLRLPEEPIAEGWYKAPDSKAVDNIGFDPSCHRKDCELEDGCELILCSQRDNAPDIADDLDDDEDEDFVEDSDSDADDEEDPEEYDSDSSVETTDNIPVAHPGLGGENRPITELLWRSSLDHPRYIRKRKRTRGTKETLQKLLFEHLAGPGCKNRRGYSGNRITAQEMAGCDTFQCLARKNKSWEPEFDDLDFENESGCFLSSLNDFMPGRGYPMHDAATERHGVKQPWVDILFVSFRESETSAMPFHPSCFDIFMRLSRIHFNRVDIDGLWSWYCREGDAQSIDDFPHHSDVNSARGGVHRWWDHQPGKEYLAANPLFMRRLTQIFNDAISHDPLFSSEIGAFEISHTSSSASSADHDGSQIARHQDGFTKLPLELKLEILQYIGSKDIASLRLSSRAFRQLPISLWRRLLVEELPWLWEVWSTDLPYAWATVTPAQLKAEDEAKQAAQRRYLDALEIISEEMPEILEEWKAGETKAMLFRPDLLATSQEAAVKTYITSLPVINTDWYQVYRDITRHWKDLKGLQNRQRIWKAVEEVVRRIKQQRENDGSSQRPLP